MLLRVDNHNYCIEAMPLANDDLVRPMGEPMTTLRARRITEILSGLQRDFDSAVGAYRCVV